MDLSHILSLLGGVAFFLYGMSIMGNGLKRVAGNKLEAYLWKLSSTPLKGFLLGTLVAAVIQSSAATSVMVVSFVNADMMKLAQAVSIVLGSTLGTTMTGWILSLSSASGSGIVGQLLSTAVLVSVIAIASTVLRMAIKNNTAKQIGQILMGLATLLLSMSLISDAVGPLKGSSEFQNILLLFSNPVLGILAGAFVSSIVQSCSAGVGILQALCVTGAIPYSVCLPLILGINLGAATPVLFSMVGVSKNAKRASLAYLYINFFSIAAVYVIYLPIYFLNVLPILSEPSTVFGIAVLNTLLRVYTSIVLLPLNKVIERMIYLTIPVTKNEHEDEEMLDKLTDSLVNYPPAAIEQAQNAVFKMADVVRKNLERAVPLLNDFDRSQFNLVQDKEQVIDKYEDKLGNFVVKLNHNELSNNEDAAVSEMLSTIGDLERIGDHASNISEVAQEIFEKKIVFSDEAKAEMQLLIDATNEVLDITFRSLYQHDASLAIRVEPLEEIVDDMIKLLRARHIERLQRNNCTIVMGFVFSDMLTNFERISDHCSNIAFSVMHSFDLNSEGHQYTEVAGGTLLFKEEYEAYRQKYLAPISD